MESRCGPVHHRYVSSPLVYNDENEQIPNDRVGISALFVLSLILILLLMYSVCRRVVCMSTIVVLIGLGLSGLHKKYGMACFISWPNLKHIKTAAGLWVSWCFVNVPEDVLKKVSPKSRALLMSLFKSMNTAVVGISHDFIFPRAAELAIQHHLRLASLAGLLQAQDIGEIRLVHGEYIVEVFEVACPELCRVKTGC